MAKIDFTYDNLGNIEYGVTENGMTIKTDIPNYNVIVKDDDLTVVRAKQKVQKNQYNKYIVDDDTDSESTDIED